MAGLFSDSPPLCICEDAWTTYKTLHSGFIFVFGGRKGKSYETLACFLLQFVTSVTGKKYFVKAEFHRRVCHPREGRRNGHKLPTNSFSLYISITSECFPSNHVLFACSEKNKQGYN